MLDVLLIGLTSSVAFAGVMLGFYSYKKFTSKPDGTFDLPSKTNAELLDDLREEEMIKDVQKQNAGDLSN